MCGYVRVIVVLLILTTKVCAASGKSLPSHNEAHAQAQDTKRQTNSSSTSYYHHDPYGPNTYAFGYEVDDKRSGNVQFRDERRYTNGSVEGSYGHVRPDGRIMVTHFLADKQRGYMSQTQTFAAGDEAAYKWQPHWPTKRPDIFLVRPEMIGPPTNVTYDSERHLNLTMDKVPESVALAVKEQHGVDLNTVVDLEDQLLSPIVEDVINGEIPLKQQKETGKSGNSTLGFETVHEFIPPDFQIAPFELPEKLEHQLEVEQQHKTTKLKEPTTTTEQTKYDKAKVNNAEKVMHHMEHLIKEGHATDLIHEEEHHHSIGSDKTVTEMIKMATPKSLSDTEESETSVGNQTWYEKVIAGNRRDFLENIPNLV